MMQTSHHTRYNCSTPRATRFTYLKFFTIRNNEFATEFTRILGEFYYKLAPPPLWKKIKKKQRRFRFPFFTCGYMFSTMANTTMKSEFNSSGWNMLKQKT